MSVTKQNQIEHNDCLNLQLKLKEEKEYWEDKLLELKLKNCKTNFIEEKSSQNLKSKLLRDRTITAQWQRLWNADSVNTKT